jgi:hypothetical protein
MRHAVLHGVGLSTESAAHNSAVSPAIPALAFNAADQAALTAFGATHRNFILDALSWRGNLNIDEQRFSQNEAFQLAAAGGGVVLGADDASGALILQHVDQVAGWFNLNRFTGIYNTAPAKHVFGGLFLNSPNSVDPTNVVGSTSYAEVPHGLQPNRVVLATAVFGFDSEPQPIFFRHRTWPARRSPVSGGRVARCQSPQRSADGERIGEPNREPARRKGRITLSSRRPLAGTPVYLPACGRYSRRRRGVRRRIAHRRL